MHGWVKYFIDGTKEIGTDEDVGMKKASWSRGRLTGMSGAEVIHGNKRIAIEGFGDFWQSDDYEVDFLEPTPSLVIRRLQMKVTKEHPLLVVKRSPDSVSLSVIGPGFGGTNIIRPAQIDNQWLTLEYNVKTGTFCFEVKGERI